MINALNEEGWLYPQTYENMNDANAWIVNHNALTYMGETTRKQRGEDFMALPGKAFNALKAIGSDPEKRKAVGENVSTAIEYYREQTRAVPSTDSYGKRRKIDYDSSMVPYGMENPYLSIGPSEDYPRGEIVTVD